VNQRNKITKRFIEDERIFIGRYQKEIFSTVCMAYYPYRWAVFVAVIIAFFARGLLLLSTNLIGVWADSLTCTSQVRDNICVGVPAFFKSYEHSDFINLIALMLFLGFIFNIIFRLTIARIGVKAVGTLYDEVTIRTSRLPASFYDRNPVGRVVSRFSADYSSLLRMAGGPMAEFLCQIFDLLLIFVCMSLVSVLFIPLLAITLYVNFLVYVKNRDMLRNERRSVSVSRAPAITHFVETVQGVGSIKVFGKNHHFLKKFNALVGESMTQRISSLYRFHFFSFQMGSIVTVLLLMTGLSGVFFLSYGIITIGSFAVALSFVMVASSTAEVFFNYLSNMEDALTGVERLDDYLRRDLEVGTKLPVKTKFSLSSDPSKDFGSKAHVPVTPLPKKASVVFDNVSLRYRDDLPWVLKNISFTVEAGEHIGVIGKTGSGKSTLLQSLFLLYPFADGKVVVGGKVPAVFSGINTDLSLEEYRSYFSLIPQDPALLWGSLRSNLVENSKVNDERLLEVLKIVGLEDWLKSLGSDPLSYLIHERGLNMSAGQRQLICMARCILQERPVLVMDEATSNIDPQSEEKIVRATQELFAQKTQIIVAHRLSTIELCDRLLWLDNGVVRLYGPPEEVLPYFLG
jgi:ABC-type multidrug transport system fused ATPase/permease subunit